MPKKSHIRRIRNLIAAAAFAVLFAAPAAMAELPQARLTSVFPAGAKQGATVEVTVTGQDLDDATQLVFSHAALSAKPKTDSAGKPEAGKFIVTVAAAAPLGVHDVRIAGRYGVSNARAFNVGTLPETVNKPGNTTPATAAELPLGAAVYAVSEANNVHYYKLPLKAGQRIFIEADARDLDSRMNPVVGIFDAAGRELARNRRGDVLDFAAASEATYLVKVYDLLYRGGPEYYYRLSAQSGARIDFVYPPAGVPGTKSKFTLYGRNLPGGTLAEGLTIDGRPVEKIETVIDIPGDPAARSQLASMLPATPASALLDGFDYRLSAAGATSNAIRLYYSAAPVILEDAAKPNDKPDQAQKIAVPCEFTGQFYPKRDTDWVSFDAPKGSVFWIEVIASRMDIPCAPFMLIQKVTKDAKGEEKATDVQEVYESPVNVGGMEFNTASRDPSFRLDVKEAGTYRVMVRDLFTSASNNPGAMYRLAIRPEQPDFRLVAFTPSPPPEQKDQQKSAQVWNPLVRRGGAAPIRVGILRKDGFAGPVTVSVKGLPAGVTCPDIVVPPGANSATLIVSAADNAAAWVGPLDITGSAKVGDAEIVREARAGTVSSATVDANNNNAVHVVARRTQQFMLAVSGSETAAVSIAPKDAKIIEAQPGAKVNIPVVVKRNGEVPTLTMKISGLPVAPGNQPEASIAPNLSEINVVLDLAQAKLAPGTYTLYVEAQSKFKYKPGGDAVKSAEDAAKAADKAATEAAAAKKKAEQELADAKKAKAAPEVIAAAEKKLAELSAKAKETETAKTATAAKAKELSAKMQPKDTTAAFYSSPIVIRVAAPAAGKK